jgi:hypothetical protein
MASASSFVEDDLADPQIQKRTPEQSAGKASQMTTETIKKKKKILIQEDEWYVKHVLSYNPEDITEPEVPDFCFKSDPMLASQLYMMRANLALHDKYTKEKMLEKQMNFFLKDTSWIDVSVS